MRPASQRLALRADERTLIAAAVAKRDSHLASQQRRSERQTGRKTSMLRKTLGTNVDQSVELLT